MYKIVFILGLLVLGGCSAPTGHVVGEIEEEIYPTSDGFVKLYFCPKDNCSKYMSSLILGAKESIYCAFYDLDLEPVISALKYQGNKIDKDIKIVIDNDYYLEIPGVSIRQDTSSQYMHNKFCIIDSKTIFTGSMNPTYNGNYKNNNNLLIIESEYIVSNYEDEFNELWNQIFGNGVRVKYPITKVDEIKIENYFCPDDSCSEKIIEHILSAEESVYFMTFSFTHESIADAMLFNEKIDIKGIFEAKQKNVRGGQYNRLKGFNVDVKLDNNSATMHHKVFIIDSEIVITGSMNPTKSGDNRNDENVLIIHDKKIATKFTNEFNSLWKG